MSGTYDYIIVGAGSAGCVLANRLSADPAIRVLLLEAGGQDDAFFISMPSGYGKVIGDPRYDWCYVSGPEPHLNGRELFTPRGKVLGGSSSINGLAYVRGHAADFDAWHGSGNEGWSWSDVLPLFRRIENFAGPLTAVRSSSGMMHVSMLEPHPLSLKLIQASVQAGLPGCRDYNDGNPLGLGLLQMNTWHGRRFSSTAAYLKPALNRRNLHVATGACVSRILLEGRTALGVAYRLGDTELHAHAECEVILAAGSINSPKLLELSGIGSPDVLMTHGIPVVDALPGVGANLQDHYNVGLQLQLRGIGSLNEQMRGWRAILHGARYVLTRSGPLANSPAQVTGYAKVMHDAASADIQLWGMPGSVVVKRGSKGENKLEMADEPGVSLSFSQNRPLSLGFVHVRSADAGAPPRIVNNYLADPLDCQIAVRGLRLCRRILEQAVFDPYRAGSAGPDAAFTDDTALLDYARASGRSSYHLVGTCRMGRGPGAVVDASLRVHGLQRLRVVDSSVMPQIVSANTHAATVMIAERGADLLLAARRQMLAA